MFLRKYRFEPGQVLTGYTGHQAQEQIVGSGSGEDAKRQPSDVQGIENQVGNNQGIEYAEKRFANCARSYFQGYKLSQTI